MDVLLPDLALDVEGLECDGVVGDDGDGVPDILGTFLLEEGDAAGVLPAEHGLDCELEPLFAS